MKTMRKNKIKIRCINNKPFHIDQDIQNLTIGKIYESCDHPDGNAVSTINDLGNEVYYSMKRFELITLKEIREERLKEIGI